MRLLVIKTSSMGDVLHTLPAITDAAEHRADLEIDWLVEESYAAIPAWHPAINRVIPVALRRWRKNWKSGLTGELTHFLQCLRQQRYDRIIDAQGLMKSAILGLSAKGPVVGMDCQSAREPLASLTYQNSFAVPKQLNAVGRLRLLFSTALAYPLVDSPADYGIDLSKLSAIAINPHLQPGIVLLQGTTWPSKLWPLSSWKELASRLTAAGYPVYCVWGSAAEQQAAIAITESVHGTTLLPALSLGQLAQVLAQNIAAVAVDTGPGHLAAAVGTPCVSLYLATDPKRTGTVGPNQQHLKASYPCAPCLQRQCHQLTATIQQPPCNATLPPATVHQNLQRLIRQQPPTAVS